MEETRRVADYFVIAGLPDAKKEKLQPMDEYSLEVNLKPSAYQDPITDVTVSGSDSNLHAYLDLLMCSFFHHRSSFLVWARTSPTTTN